MNTKAQICWGGWVVVGVGVGYYNFPRSTNKIKSFNKISTSEKNYIFFAFFCCRGGSNLILGTGMENQIFILRTPAAIKFFHQILKNCQTHYPCRWICMTQIEAPTLFPRRILIFQGVLTKFHILTKFPHLEKNCPFNERLKNMSTKAFFPCGGGSNLILGTGTENHIFILRAPAAINCFIKFSKNDTLV